MQIRNSCHTAPRAVGELAGKEPETLDVDCHSTPLLSDLTLTRRSEKGQTILTLLLPGRTPLPAPRALQAGPWLGSGSSSQAFLQLLLDVWQDHTPSKHRSESKYHCCRPPKRVAPSHAANRKPKRPRVQVPQAPGPSELSVNMETLTRNIMLLWPLHNPRGFSLVGFSLQ